ncbi:hypothetical protein CSC70_09875 [Pseudoxanthomonas kalamensis DSM 18571]|uniref:TraB/GumN family protein n=1 Tax=Pseudoxanthomonas kalamensis TaxID=289483 RepID=UPI00139160A1|nr:TraB/GumN family protein [Pseudoxanthomonas kalamensis]KAF1709977.1 hypothetical protein CSC70_09875 [Pseudoxanthomonas kalamensis DSM 18571]
MSKRNHYRSLLAACLLFGCAFGSQAENAPASAAADAKPLLWKVSDADNAVYLLGSFHLLKPSDYPLPAEVDAAFDDAESLVFELGPEALAAPDIGQKFLAAGMFDDGSTLKQVLSEETYAKLDQMMKMGGGAAAVDTQEPWFLTLGMVMGFAQANGFRPELGLDQHLMQRAAEADKPAAGLETFDEQLQILARHRYPSRSAA